MYELARESFTSRPRCCACAREDRHQGICPAEGAAGEETGYFQDMKLNLLDTHHH